MASIYTRIINRELPGHFIYDDDKCVVILDKFPQVEGQSLVIPKAEVDYAFDLDEETYEHIFKVAKKIALASDKALSAKRTCLVLEGFHVPHVHIRLYPMQSTEDSLGNYMSGGEEASDESLASIAEKIKSAL